VCRRPSLAPCSPPSRTPPAPLHGCCAALRNPCLRLRALPVPIRGRDKETVPGRTKKRNPQTIFAELDAHYSGSSVASVGAKLEVLQWSRCNVRGRRTFLRLDAILGRSRHVRFDRAAGNRVLALYRGSLRTLKPLGIRPPGEMARELQRQYGIEPSGTFRPYAGPPWRQPGALKNYKEIAPGHWRPLESIRKHS
jgi:hypothetical protein